jgi:hypothetical protein
MDELFLHRSGGGRVRRPLSPLLAALAAILLLAEVAARKARLPENLPASLRLGGGAEEAPRMSALQAARERVAKRLRPGRTDTDRAPDAPVSEVRPEAPSPPPPEPAEEQRVEAPPPTPPPDESLTSRLLESKRRRTRRTE